MKKILIKILRLYTIYFPIRFGKIPMLKLFSRFGVFNDIILIAKFDSDIKAKFTIGDWVQQLVYFFGTYIYERQEVNIWIDYSKRSNNILDIGANFGFYSLLSAKYNSKANIFSFEPSPAMFERINENLKLNKNRNIKVFQQGVSDKKGQFDFYISEDSNTGMSSMTRRINSKQESIAIDVIDVDSFIMENNIKTVDLIKIDVEGNEFNVLKGMSNILRSHKPVVFVELYGENLKSFGHTVQNVVDYMNEFGYICFECQLNGDLRKVDSVRDIPLAVFLFEY